MDGLKHSLMAPLFIFSHYSTNLQKYMSTYASQIKKNKWELLEIPGADERNDTPSSHPESRGLEWAGRG